MNSDPVANMLTTIRNAAVAHRQSVTVPHSKLNYAILEVLRDANFIGVIRTLGRGVQTTIEVELNLQTEKPAIRHIRRLSRPGLRRYCKSSEIPRPLGGFGLIIMSTPKGVMSGLTARAKGLGGELLCEVS